MENGVSVDFSGHFDNTLVYRLQHRRHYCRQKLHFHYLRILYFAVAWAVVDNERKCSVFLGHLDIYGATVPLKKK